MPFWRKVSRFGCVSLFCSTLWEASFSGGDHLCCLRNLERIYTSVVYTSADRCGDWRHPGHRSPVASDTGCPPRPVWFAGPGTGWRPPGACGAGGPSCAAEIFPQSTFPLRLLCGCCSADCRLLCFADILFCFWFLHPICCFFFITETLR